MSKNLFSLSSFFLNMSSSDIPLQDLIASYKMHQENMRTLLTNLYEEGEQRESIVNTLIVEIESVKFIVGEITKVNPNFTISKEDDDTQKEALRIMLRAIASDSSQSQQTRITASTALQNTHISIV